jgi:hypothetical protein
MNVSRLVASVGGYFVSTAADGVAFHLYGGISTEVEIGGARVKLREVSEYPWNGAITIHVDPTTPTEFDVKLRIPGWCTDAGVRVNGERLDMTGTERGYVTVRRAWSSGDVIELNLPMPPVRLYANPGVIDDAGRVALKRGPLVYCVEEADNPGGRAQRFRLPRDAQLRAEHHDAFDGIVALRAEAIAVDESEFRDLYRTSPPKEGPSPLTAIPYFLWANRQQGSMVVWIPEAARQVD